MSKAITIRDALEDFRVDMCRVQEVLEYGATYLEGVEREGNIQQEYKGLTALCDLLSFFSDFTKKKLHDTGLSLDAQATSKATGVRVKKP